MFILLALVAKILPLYFLISLGFVAGRYLQVSKESVAKLLIYIIAPAVIFNSVFTTPLAANILSLPVLFFFICCGMCLITLFFVKRIWSDATKNILAFTAGSGNTGYFGLPVAIALFGPEVAGLVVICTLGFVLYENTVGFFVTARGNHTMAESMQRLIRLPTIYAFIIALTLNTLGMKFGQPYAELALLFRGAYTILGMMMIGLALASIKDYTFDFKFVTATLLIKFIVWPVLIFSLITIDRLFVGFFSNQIHQVMSLMAIVPLAANTVAYATELKAHPDKAAFAVLLSTLVALLYIPLVSLWLF